MTDIKQLEQGTQNIEGLNEHGPFCECIWCIERDTQSTGIGDPAKEEIEQEMATMLKELPLSIAIAKQDAPVTDEYAWQCAGISGKATSFVDATREALQSMIAVLQ